MAWNSALFEPILAMIVAVLFALAGVVNLAGLGGVKRDFARWGYPAWFHWLCGALELLGAALLFEPATRGWGLTLAAAILVAALFTLLRNREPFGHIAPPLVFMALVVATVALRA